MVCLLAAGRILDGAEASSFVFETTSPASYAAAYLGNGAVSLVTTPLGTGPSRSFLAGVYDHTQGDVPRIAAAADWNEFDIYNGRHWLNTDSSFTGIENYRQELNMYDGVLRTSYIWVDSEKKVAVKVEQFVSRERAALAAAQLTITPDFSGTVKIRLPLRNWPTPRRYALERIPTLQGEARTNPWAIWYPGHLNLSDGRVENLRRRVWMAVLATAPGTGMRTGEAVSVEWTGNAQVQTQAHADSAETELTVDAVAGRSCTFTKLAALVPSFASSDPMQMAISEANDAAERGWTALLQTSERAWHELWETDLIVDGDTELQRTIHSMLFYLFASARKDLEISTGPMGLSSAGYYGHIFWDADIFMFPALVLLHPELARPMVAFRSRTLDAARQNAKKNNYQGAMYPWEAGPDGAEATPRFAAQNASSENHVNGDVALASWQYWLATGDRDWLRNHCWPMLRDTADFWISRVNYDKQRQRYEISHVVGVNESEVGVSNDAYTNAIAKKNLELAMAAAAELHLESHAKWREVAEKMYLPGSKSALLWYPLDEHRPRAQTLEAIAEMQSSIARGLQGAMMGTEFYPILAAEAGRKAAIGRMLIPLVNPYLRAPFQVVAETPHNQNTNFITGAGAFLQQFVFGYTGLRLGANGLEKKYEPVLPPDIHGLTLRNITIRGKSETLVFGRSKKKG